MEIPKTLLIVEDDPGLQSQMRWCFEDLEVILASDRKAAEAELIRHRPSVVTLDLGLPPDAGGTAEGFALLRTIQKSLPHTKVIVITGREERDAALQAIAAGAYDFYQKPIDARTLKFAVTRAFKLSDLEAENKRLSRVANVNMPLPGLLARSQVMLDLCRQVEKVAPADVSVLINGETGTGKEVIARNIHELSARHVAPMVAINCAAIPENLLESELFGHEKGSFTGAHARKIGKVEAANGGTLFLDEIGDMPLLLQGKILRFLQDRKFERVGSTVSMTADLRLITATHRVLPDMIAQGTFREDLFHRINEIALELPPLRARGDDVIMIAQHLLEQNQGVRALTFDAAAIDALKQWPWTGNVRELENKVRRAAIMANEDSVMAYDLGLSDDSLPAAPLKTLKEVRAESESSAVYKALLAAGNNISQASKLLGVSRPTLYSLMQKYNHVNEESEQK